MSVHQGLLSPPLSGRTSKGSQPFPSEDHKVLQAHDVFDTSGAMARKPSFSGMTSRQASSTRNSSGISQHTMQSPIKKSQLASSDADDDVRPPTPPMSKDVRHDEQIHDHERTTFDHQPSSDSEQVDALLVVQDSAHQRYSEGISSSPIHPETAPTILNLKVSPSALHSPESGGQGFASRFKTLTKAADFCSDDEQNPFLDRNNPPSTSVQGASVSALAYHSHPYLDEFDSDMDAEGSADEEDHHIAETYAPARRTHLSLANDTRPAVVYRPTRPLSTRIRVESQPSTSVIPIRDTPNNPFLAGGPADNGFHGPRAHLARHRANQIPGKERGKITYVFRGQRVTYADPEYDSDDDDDDDDDRTRHSEFNPYHNPDRPPRLRPKLLFPQGPIRSQRADYAGPMSSSNKGSCSHAHAQSSAGSRTSFTWGWQENASSHYAPHQSSSSKGNSCKTGLGLFASQIAARQKQKAEAAQEALRNRSAVGIEARTHAHIEDDDYDSDNDGDVSLRHNTENSGRPDDRREARGEDVGVVLGSCVSLQGVTFSNHTSERYGNQAERDALLARLDQTNWSDDDEDDTLHPHQFHQAQLGRTDDAAIDKECEVERGLLDRLQTERKRPSKTFVERIQHTHSIDEVGNMEASHGRSSTVVQGNDASRPWKRHRASYAF